MSQIRRFGPVWFIQGTNRGKYPYCNSVYLEGPGLLIDPASDRAALKELKDGPGVNQVWLSHWHEDHFMHLDLFEDVPFSITEIEAPPLSDPEVFMDWYGLHDQEFRNYWRQALKTTFNYRSRKPADFLVPGETRDLDGITIEVIPAAGHTPGHLAFFFPGTGALFMGDYDLTRFGPWYGDRDSSIEDTIESVNRLRKIPARVWLTGHEDGVFEDQPGELWDNYLAVIDQREQKLIDFLAEPRTMDDVVNAWIVYRKPREPRGFFEFGERAIMGKHIERLTGQARVEMQGETYCLVR